MSPRRLLARFNPFVLEGNMTYLWSDPKQRDLALLELELPEGEADHESKYKDKEASEDCGGLRRLD